MGRLKSSKEDVNASSAESVQSSDDVDEPEYVVERIVDKKFVKNKVCEICWIRTVILPLIQKLTWYN